MDEKRLVDGTTALAEKQSRVIKIEPAERPQNVRLRVAAYTRVSSDSEDQLNSFAAQNRYYTELISSKAEWRMVDIYADEGITGTSVAKRDDFQRMMADCRRGLIDQILVKSISRFARNTKDCLQNIRELKELGVNVRFEREGIDNALEQQPIDEDNAKALILQLAAEQYAALGDEEYETNRLRRLFTAFECVAELNADLLKSTVSGVLVTRQNVKLRLKNGQVIERSDLQ